MKIVAETVLPTEKCWGLYEGPALIPLPDGSTDHHWVQDVTVIRGDHKAHFVTDFGPASKFEYVTPIMIPGFGDDTVQEVQYLAEQNRHDFYWQKRAEEMLSESTLIRDVIRQEEEIHQINHNRSMFGADFKKQRNGYSQVSMERRLREKREKYYGRTFTGSSGGAT